VASGRIERRLSAVLAADVADYSRLMEEFEIKIAILRIMPGIPELYYWRSCWWYSFMDASNFTIRLSGSAPVAISVSVSNSIPLTSTEHSGCARRRC